MTSSRAANPFCARRRQSVSQLSSLAEREPKIISERTKAALQVAKALGTWLENPRVAEARAAVNSRSAADGSTFAITAAPVKPSASDGGSLLTAIVVKGARNDTEGVAAEVAYVARLQRHLTP